MRLIDADKIMADIAASARSTSKDYSLLSIARYISIQPTIDAEPVRHGRWQVYEAFGVKDMTCSVCGWLYEYYAGLEEEWNYCSHCGAKMLPKLRCMKPSGS